MAQTSLLEGNGLLDIDAPATSSQAKADELFPTATDPFRERDLNLFGSPASQSEAQKALNAWGSQAPAKLSHHPYIPSPDRGESMDFDADLDLDQLLDEEMSLRQDEDVQQQPQQPSSKFIPAGRDDDELEAFLLAEEEHAVSRPSPPQAAQRSQKRPPSPPHEFFTDYVASADDSVLLSSRASSSASDLLESNGLLGTSSQPSSQHSVTPASKSQALTALPFPTSAQGSLRAIEALSTIEMEAQGTDKIITTREALAGPSRLPLRAQPVGVPKYIPAGFLNATTMDGTPVRFERRKRMKGWKPPAIMVDVDASQLLERPIHQLLDAVQALKALDVVERDEAQRDQSRRTKNLNTAEASKAAAQMWVDKHRPGKFTELLGDERVHREVLGWLKEWDECVFKRKNHRKERHRQYIQAKYGFADHGAGDKGGEHMWKDPYGRPKERIMMISGPPGLGKTTLAHVIGAHAGYNVYELNASDARTAGAVEDVIKMALESGSLKDPRPTLVVIDEIDGATGGGGGASGESHGFVRALVRLVEMGKGAGPKAAGLASRGKKQQRKGYKPLLRPIICICNDLYAPSLRPLRPLAKLIRFNKPPTNLVVKRLREVCEVEALSVEARGLSLLAELTNGDIRSCLNALEFAKTKNIALTEAAVKNASIGIKDTGGTVHKAWEMLFRRQNRRQAAASSMKGANANAADADGSPWNSSRKASAQDLTSDGKEKQKDFALIDTPRENVNRIIHEVISCNEYEKLAQGCFEHYPTLRAADGGWKRYRQVHDWLHFGQSITSRAWSQGSFELLGFMPWSFVCWHLLFAHVGNALPEYPKVDYENHLKASAFNEIASQVIGNLPANVRSQFNRHSVITELGPSLMRILTPDLRPINNQLSRAEDKQAFGSLVSIMTSLNIKFVQDKISEEEAAATGQSAGQLVYKLDPPLDIFTQFEGKRSKEVGPSRFAVRQLVAREMERQLLRKNAGVEDGEDDAGSASKSATAIYRSKSANADAARDSIKNKKEKMAVDFFGRPIVQKSASVPAALSAVPIPEGMGGRKRKVADGRASSATDVTCVVDDQPAQSDDASAAEAKDETAGDGDGKIKVFYRYHEGFSNAVRRPMKISSLL
ncbi:related to CTF18 - Chromosome Transmission Fidelity factor [Ustilago trichophora]|uniref:Related to CTF18 - Chromosome Transmission Fidelity factor n=1 Tax=Ustilago trichophora TaxID=86804 RepID=A0A5C3E2E5_9BASI|nr:related to CTF18 - Chromosome Transmission Fidelity factor [Ustilago trichophora]